MNVLSQVPEQCIHFTGCSLSCATNCSSTQAIVNGSCCPICAESMQNGMLASLPCGHVHHHHCLKQCLQVNPQCPMCNCRSVNSRMLLFNKSMSLKGSFCSICCESLQVGLLAVPGHCGHVHHEVCLQPRLVAHPFCPICKRQAGRKRRPLCIRLYFCGALDRTIEIPSRGTTSIRPITQQALDVAISTCGLPAATSEELKILEEKVHCDAAIRAALVEHLLSYRDCCVKKTVKNMIGALMLSDVWQMHSMEGPECERRSFSSLSLCRVVEESARRVHGPRLSDESLSAAINAAFQCGTPPRKSGFFGGISSLFERAFKKKRSNNSATVTSSGGGIPVGSPGTGGNAVVGMVPLLAM